MKRYRFPLAQVLRVRRLEADAAAGALAAAHLAEHSAALLRQSRLDACAALASNDFCDPAAGKTAGGRDVEVHNNVPAGPALPVAVPADRFLTWREQCLRAGAAAGAAIVAHGATVVAVDDRRTDWGAAAMRVSALEHLDDRRRAEHRADALRSEIVAADDLVTSRRRPS